MDWLRFSNPRRKHKDVQFHVDDAGGGERVFDTWDEATGFATAIAGSGKPKVYVDVIVWSEAGARWWGGDDAVEQYREDPDASVFNRYEVKIDDQGRVR